MAVMRRGRSLRPKRPNMSAARAEASQAPSRINVKGWLMGCRGNLPPPARAARGGEGRLGRSPSGVGGGWIGLLAMGAQVPGQAPIDPAPTVEVVVSGKQPPTPLGLAAEADLPTTRCARGGRRALDIQRFLVRERRALLDEGEAGFGLVAHQALDGVAGLGALVMEHRHPQQRALPRVHGGLLELRRRHLAEALEAADLDLAVALEGGLEELVLVGVVAGVNGVSPLRQPVERRDRQIQVAL